MIVQTRKEWTVTVFGQRLHFHHAEKDRDVVWVYGWRDVLARPVTGSWLAASPK